MGLTVQHVKTLTQPDSTNPDIVRPTDWNSGHVVNFSQDVVLGGNTAGVTVLAADKLYLHGGNNVTLSGNGSTVTVIAAAGGVGGGGAEISAGTQSQSTGTVIFSNANGVSFGLDNGTLTGSVRTDYLTTAQPPGAYLTTAALSGHSHNFATTTTNGAQIVVGTTNSDGVTIGVPAFLTTAQAPGAYLTTARASNDAIGLNTALTANGVSVTANSSGLSINVPAFLTTAAVSNVTTNNMATAERGNYFYTSNNTFANSTHSHGMVTTTTNGSQVTIAGNSGGYTLAVPPFVTAAAGGGDGYNIIGVNGAGTALSTTVQFNDGNNVSFGLNAGTITASASYVNDLTSGRAGTGYTSTTQAGATVGVTNNTSGLSMAWPPFLTTAQAPGAYLTTARASNDAIGLNSGLTANGVSMTANSSGLSLNFPAFLTTADLSQNSSKYAGTGSGFTGGASISATLTHNTQGLSINLSHPAWLTTAALSANTSNYAGLGTTFAGANITGNVTLNTAGLNLSLSVAAPGAAAENNWFTLGGNVSGNSTASGSTIQLYGGNNITLSGGGNSAISIIGAAGGGAGYTAMSLQNRQLGASTTLNSMGGQNSLWMAPVRVGVPVSASTILAAMASYSGTITSAATAQVGQTLRAGIWSQHTDPASSTQFGLWWSGNISNTFWNSGTSSVSYAISLAGGQTTGSSAGSNLLTASVMGARMMILPIGSTMTAGLYVFGILNSSSSAGYSAAMSRMAMYMDNPVSLGMGTMGQATNNSIGYADGGTYGTTTGALPSTVALSQIYGVANVMPYFKVGAL